MPCSTNSGTTVNAQLNAPIVQPERLKSAAVEFKPAERLVPILRENLPESLLDVHALLVPQEGVLHRTQDPKPKFLEGAGNSGVCLGVCFSRQSTTSSLELTGSDARFPSKVRQIDVIGLCYVLVCNQEVAGSIPVRSTLTNNF